MEIFCNILSGRRTDGSPNSVPRSSYLAIAVLAFSLCGCALPAQSSVIDFSDQGGYQSGYIMLEGMNEGDFFDLGLMFTTSSSTSDVNEFKARLGASGMEYEAETDREVWLADMEAKVSGDNYFAWDLGDIGTGTLHVAAIVMEPALLTASGGVGGPFEPSSAAIELKNTHATEDMSWSATVVDYGNTDLEWLSISGSGGNLAPGVSHILQFELSESAEQLAFGWYAAEVELTTTVDGQSETWSRKVFLRIEPSFPIPYTQDFESSAPESSPSVLGWLSDGSDSSRIIELLYDYDGVLPLPTSEHSQVLRMETGEDPLSLDINMQTSQFSRVYMDVMTAFSPSYRQPSDNEDFKLEIFMNLDEDLVLAHGGADGAGSTLSIIADDLKAGEWYRLTVLIDFDAVERQPFFQVAIDGNILSSVDSGFASPTSDPAKYGGGSYFRFANSENQSVEDLLKIRRIDFAGGGAMIDDFVLRTDNPLDSSFFVRTELVLAQNALMTSASEWMEPRGDFVAEPFESYELEVDSGTPVSITYTAEDLHYIQSLSSHDSLSLHGADLELDPAQNEYAWSLGSVHADVTNRIVFAPRLYEDGKSPQWWVETLSAEARQAAESGESELTVYQGYLLNHGDLESPFVIVDAGIDEEGKAFVQWLNDGDVRGSLLVMAAGDLSTARDDWSLIHGEVSHEPSLGLSTWLSSGPAEDKNFIVIQVIDN